MQTIDNNTSGHFFKDIGSSPRIVRDILPNEDFQVSQINAVSFLGGSGTTNVAIKDASFINLVATSGIAFTNYPASILLNSFFYSTINYSSSNTSVATIDQVGSVTRIKDGTSNIFVSVSGVGTRKYGLVCSSIGNISGMTFNTFVSGSLGYHLSSGISNLLVGRTAPTFIGNPPYAFNKDINILAPDGSRNTSGWWGSVDLTCIPTDLGLPNGVLITKRDMIFAAHGPASSGTVRTFRDNNNNVTTRTVMIGRQVGSTDIYVSRLDSDVPSGISPAKLLPSNIRNYLPQPQYGYPVAYTNQDRTLLIRDVVSIPSGQEIFASQSTDPVRKQWFYPIRGGDSGSPCGTIISGMFVPILDWHFTGAFGPNYADNISGINSAITANGSPYSVSLVNLSGFLSY